MCGSAGPIRRIRTSGRPSSWTRCGGVAVGFDGDGQLRVVADTTDLDLFEREQLVDKLHELVAKVLDGRLGRALH